MTLKDAQHIHFIGIGGIGVSALAAMFLHEGKKVSGSDSQDSAILAHLGELGATTFVGHDAAHIADGVDLVIYTIAAPEDNPERAEAHRRGITELSYPEALGVVSKEKYTIAVSGTHGKTTTTAMIAEILIAAQKEPTVVVGSILKSAGSNFVAGGGDYLVAEACEYRRSFLNLSPTVLVITNIDADHLDYYKDLADIQKAFGEMVAKVPTDGFVICDPKDAKVAPALAGAAAKSIDYTSQEVPELSFPGEHNVKNAQAAAAVAAAMPWTSPPP